MVLWTTVLIAAAAGSALAVARRGALTSRNRLDLLRGRWASEACLEILREAVARDSVLAPLRRIDLGRGTWCSVAVEPAGARVDLNTADSAALSAVLERADLVDAVMDWRDADDFPRPHGLERERYAELRRLTPRNAPLGNEAELRFVAGFDDSVLGRVLPLVAVDVDAPIPLLTAPRPVLKSLPGLTDETIEVLGRLRQAGSPPPSLEELAGLVSPLSREALLARFDELARVSTLRPDRFDLVVLGGVEGSPVSHEVRIRAVLTDGRIGLLRRVDW